MKLKNLLLSAALLSAANATILVTFDFTGGSVAASEVIGTASDFSSDLAGASAATEAFGFNEAQANDARVTNSFTYTVSGLATGETLNLTSIDYDYSGEYAWGTQINFNNTGWKDQQTDNFSISYSESLTDRGLSNGDMVTFSWEHASASNFNDTARTQYLDNIVLNGTVVPEPTSLALLGLGGLALVTRRKRA